MVHVRCAAARSRKGDGAVFYAVKISLRYVHAYRIVLFKMLKAYLKKRRLKLVHARIYAFKIVDILLAASIVSKLS